MQEPVIEIQDSGALLKRCRRGEEQAYRQLYDRYCKPMYNICMRMLNHTAEAEDVLQESFIAAFSRMDHLKNENAFAGWLRRIVVNRCIDQVRKRAPFAGELKDDIAGEDAGEEHESGLEYDAGIIREALSRLPNGYRVILTLYLFEDYSHRAIAEKLGISEGTSKSQYARGRRQLASLIKKLNDER